VVDYAVAVTSIVELFELLAEGNVEGIVGSKESQWLEFKSEPYYLDTRRGVADLAADVAAFANANLGAILLGVREEAMEGTRDTVAVQVRGVAVGLVDDARILAVVRQHVYPLVRIEFRRSLVDHQRELVVVIVHPVGEHERPCVVDRVAVDDRDRRAHAFGWPVRHGADTHWETPSRVQQLIAVGLRPPVVGDSLIQVGLDTADEHLAILDRLEGWEDWPRIIVQAIPRRPGRRIADFFGMFAERVRAWRGVRRGEGFDLMLDNVDLERVGSNLVSSNDRRFVAISRSGLLTAAANGTPDMLGWAMNERTPWDQLRAVVASPYPTVEFPSEAVHFTAEVLGQEVDAQQWTYRVIGQRLLRPTPLALQYRPGMLGSSHRATATTDAFAEEVANTDDVWRDAFEVVSEIFGAGFGLGRSHVPFAVDERIDLQLMG
jgi:hypothetical protein